MRLVWGPRAKIHTIKSGPIEMEGCVREREREREREGERET